MKNRDDMLLPEGYTCADCAFINTCQAWGIRDKESKNTRCDWAPSRFQISLVVVSKLKEELAQLKAQQKP